MEIWLLVATLLHPNPDQVSSIVIATRPTREACEEFKQAAFAEAVKQYTLVYPLNFTMECKKEVMP